MVQKFLLTTFLLTLVFPFLAWSHTGQQGLVEMRVLSDSGCEFRKFRIYPSDRQQGKYFYLEAAKGAKYSIQATNKSGRRIGLVIAVDGRNIISGQQSNLKQNERMYILGPFETNTFEGWRTGLKKINRFYFTGQSDAYAERMFSDSSAMGTIALAVYREKIPVAVPLRNKSFSMRDAPAGVPHQAPAEKHSAGTLEKQASGQAGTGFGEPTISPARIVLFYPDERAAERIVLKYEWSRELCRKGIIRCEPGNRFWPWPDGFAPVLHDFRG